MITQAFVDAHADRIDAAVARFQAQILRITQEISSKTIASVFRRLSVEGGWVHPTPTNSSAIRSIDSEYQKFLKESQYYYEIQAFVAGFSSQVDEFASVYRDVRSRHPYLGFLHLDDESRIVLENQVGTAVAVLEGQAFDVSYELRQLSSKVLGGISASDLVTSVSEVIRKMSSVEQIAKDQLTTFFRLIGNLVYAGLERQGYKILYKYVGPRDPKNRKFCADLLDADGAYSRDDVDSMDNGQIPGVFDNGGGYGCRHWFVAWAVTK